MRTHIILSRGEALCSEAYRKMENKGTNKKIFNKDIKWVRNAMLVLIADILVIIFSYFFALFLRFDFSIGSIPERYIEGFIWATPLWCVLTVVVFYVMKLYHSIWSYVSISEALRVIAAYGILAVLFFVSEKLLQFDMPRSWYVIGMMIAMVLHIGVRFSYRLIRMISRQRTIREEMGTDKAERVMIIGGGAAGSVLIKEMLGSTRLNQIPVCVIDDNETKWGRSLYRVPIVGGRDVILEKAAEYDVNTIIFAIPSADRKDRQAMFDICKETGA